MSEIAEVLEGMEALFARGGRMALATIVAVRGSTYRRPGARLVVADGGEMVGNLSGGCLEGEVQQVAREVMDTGVPRLVAFDLTADDEAVWGWGLGCNGVIEVFVEPGERAAATAGALRMAIEEDRPIVSVTVLDSAAEGTESGGHLAVHPDGGSEGTLGDGDADEAAVAAARAALEEGDSRVEDLTLPTGRARAFIEVLEPAPRLLVCGAGHDAIPLVAQAAALGWRTIVADDREAFLSAERFPGAAELVQTKPADLAEAAAVDLRTYAVVMSHNYLRDRDCLRSLLGTPVAYIGMLGPRARLERVLADLAREGVRPSPEDLAKLHGPAGLDVGAEGPEEIAAAIVAEILAIRRGRMAGFLRDRKGPIHDRPETKESVSG